MIRKTEGIVLKTYKHQDANLIASLYTLEAGLQRFIIKGFRSSRARKKHSYFQPLSIIDIVFVERSSRNIQKIDESRLAHMLVDLQTHPIKLSLGLAILEIFADCVREEEENRPLFHFLKDHLVLLDQSSKQLIHIFIHFIIHLTHYLGFAPHDASEDHKKVRLFIQSGRLEIDEKKGDDVSMLLRKFLHSPIENCQEISFDQMEKKQLITLIFQYYQYHIDGFKYPQTLKVFTEIFGT